MLAGAAAPRSWPPQAQTGLLDLVIANARIVDGTGAPARAADVGLRDGRIVRIGRIAPAEARAAARRDRPGRWRPGSSTCTRTPTTWPTKPLAENFIRMGVTSIVAGNCGTSALHIGEALERIQDTTVAVNFATLIGHNTVRSAVMGMTSRDPTLPEFKAMQVLVFKGMAEGAVGFSTGLQYLPGRVRQAERDHRARARRRRTKAASTRRTCATKGTEVEAAVAESIRLVRRLDMPLEISHLKIDSPSRWGASAAVLKLIDDARARGARVEADQYAYTAGSSSLAIRFPAWALEGGDAARARAAARPVARGPGSRPRCRRMLTERGFSDLSWATVASYRAGSVDQRPVDEAGRRADDRRRDRPTRSSRPRAF